MNNKRRSKLKSASRFKHYKSFGWLGVIAYRLRGEKTIRKYLLTGKYRKDRVGLPYPFFEGSSLMMIDVVINSTVKRSRVKNIPYGAEGIFKTEEE